MTTTQNLLYAAESDITIDRIRALVRMTGPEAPTVEYKENFTPTIARGVVAMANTYGGIMLVGVTDARKIVGVKEATIQAVAQHCYSKIEPPWVPPIVAVPLDDGSDRFVLVLRIVPGQHPTPLLFENIAYVRHQLTTYPADWRRLGELFANSTVTTQDQVWDVRRPDAPHRGNMDIAGDAVEFIFRAGLNVPVSHDAQWRPLSERTVDALAAGLNKSPLEQALCRLLSGANSFGANPFRRHGLNRARLVRLVWSAFPNEWPSDRRPPVEATAAVEAPGDYGSSATHLSVHIDVVTRMGSVTEIIQEQSGRAIPPWRVAPQQLGDIIDGLMGTLTSESVVTPLAEMAGVDVVRVPQPRVLHVVTQHPITEVLYLNGLRPIPDAGQSHGAHLLGDPALDLGDSDDRHRQVRMWMSQIALDAGLLGMEQLLDQLDAARA
jgi:hypothetical protein